MDTAGRISRIPQEVLMVSVGFLHCKKDENHASLLLQHTVGVRPTRSSPTTTCRKQPSSIQSLHNQASSLSDS